jgi:hypothetical protein
VADHYQQLKRLVLVDGDRPVDEVTASIFAVIDGGAFSAGTGN